MTLLEFMYTQTYMEYEKAKRCIFGADNYSLATHVKKLGDDDEVDDSAVHGKKTITASFHPIFLSSLLNQQTFKRNYLIDNIERKIRKLGSEEKQDKSSKLRNELFDKKKQINKVLKDWVINIDNNSSNLMGADTILDANEKQNTLDLIEIFDKVTSAWDIEIENGV